MLCLFSYGELISQEIQSCCLCNQADRAVIDSFFFWWWLEWQFNALQALTVETYFMHGRAWPRHPNSTGSSWLSSSRCTLRVSNCMTAWTLALQKKKKEKKSMTQKRWVTRQTSWKASTSSVIKILATLQSGLNRIRSAWKMREFLKQLHKKKSWQFVIFVCQLLKVPVLVTLTCLQITSLKILIWRGGKKEKQIC